MNSTQYGLGTLRKRGRIWWIRYHYRGKRYEESSHSTKKRDAQQLLKQRLAEIGSGRFVGFDAERVTFADLERGLEQDYRLNARRSWRRAQQALTHLRKVFGNDRAIDITSARIQRYAVARQDEGAAPATIQYELAIAKRAFSIALRAGQLAQRPIFPVIHVSNARTGFFEESDFAALQVELPDYLRSVIAFAYYTGWRIPSEILRLTWRQVDFEAGIVRLETGTTKNREGRVFPFAVLPALRELLEEQREYTDRCEQETGRLIPSVFHRSGVPIKSYRRAWLSACKRAGLDRIPHDFRRTAVRNLERAGVPRSVAMQLIGHKTESIYRRYAIVSEADLRNGAAKLAAFMKHRDSKRETLLKKRDKTGTIHPMPARPTGSQTPARSHGVQTSCNGMARGRIELPTRGFSVRCSTN